MAVSFRIQPSRSSSITLAIIFTVLLVLSILTLLYFMRLTSSTNQRKEVAAIIHTDVQGLMGARRMGGLQELVDVLQYRLKHPVPGVIYALANQHDAVILGNIGYIPASLPQEGVIFDMTVPEDMHEFGLEQGREYAIIAAHRHLEDGYTLIVGRNMPETATPRAFINRLGWAVILMLMFLAGAGFFIGNRVVYRINLISGTANYIMRTGDLSQRIPVPSRWDDLGKLAVVLNALIERVEALMDEVRQVSDNVAHDLRTPLTRLKNQLEMLHDRGEEEQLGIEECTEKLIEEADHILATFSALLRIRNIESGRWRGEGEQVALDALVQDVVEFYEPLAQDKEQHLHVTLDTASLFGDRHLLFQAVTNLVDNAIKYAPQGGDVWVELACDAKNAITLRVTNAGSRVDEAQLGDIFKRFYRTDTARTRQSGNGLGLSLVKAIVQLHKGTVKAENTKRGFSVVVRFNEVG